MVDPDQPHESLAAHARELLDTNRYLTLGTVSRDGRPWTSPVYFSAGPDWDFYWMSSVDAEHSRNLATRPAVSITVFDSTVPPYHGRAVYAVGEAREIPPAALDDALPYYPGPPSRGGSAITHEDITGDSTWRMYQAAATELWVLCPREPRQGCALHDIAQDHRARVL
ncbi:pyridoxamine 5'-phosphate oxidase family protein [Actinoplanes sp. LDG1-06]|uniref:Pyridoxamine 5'-phosphate oxidase family protein n=1 Tax=Paractinoplanes ovalisporus TaxID=2810368 RepID=A0ABS2AUT6_9ACTN|nr:pyridoxamine 5'-phosphate oxidase family protein [Actinoplanes ovalisporus]MBM2623123.1 pyridoxamine 5'-phosphate oxidase family protein [Actinoplanes ovalisporus]